MTWSPVLTQRTPMLIKLTNRTVRFSRSAGLRDTGLAERLEAG